jgi:hypothetical protein
MRQTDRGSERESEGIGSEKMRQADRGSER